ncbi:hypothetical protein BD560DRAFT_407306 [Blakeslea trispora]|nr:hypothetical protein BD560DRAFT_407306 [Blakeslea trispora]
MHPPAKRGGHPYAPQSSESSSYVSLQNLNSHPNRPSILLHDSSDEQTDLREPVLPWMKSESRQSIGSQRSSVDASSLHIMKRQIPDTTTKKKQRWTKHKWWLLLSNTLVRVSKCDTHLLHLTCLS